MTPLAWYELERGAWTKRGVSPRSYGHGIGAGDINGDANNADQGAPADACKITAEQVLASFKALIQPRSIATVAHRGIHRFAPENTRISYVQAIEAGAPIAVYYNYAVHGVITGTLDLISGGRVEFGTGRSSNFR